MSGCTGDFAGRLRSENKNELATFTPSSRVPMQTWGSLSVDVCPRSVARQPPGPVDRYQCPSGVVVGVGLIAFQSRAFRHGGLSCVQDQMRLDVIWRNRVRQSDTDRAGKRNEREGGGGSSRRQIEAGWL